MRPTQLGRCLNATKCIPRGRAGSGVYVLSGLLYCQLGGRDQQPGAGYLCGRPGEAPGLGLANQAVTVSWGVNQQVDDLTRLSFCLESFFLSVQC